MEGKGGKSGQGNKNAGSDFDPRNERKAVIIADTYTNLLSPIKDEISEALLPVCNVPILEYMIDFLFSNSISEIIICACKNSETIKNYLKKHYNRANNIKLIASDEFQDMGDCIRKINSEKLITNDFVLIRGLIIANFNLEKAFNYHLQKKKEDPYVILTSIMKNYKNDKYVKTKYDENFLVVNKLTGQILQYESLRDGNMITLNENIKLNLSKPKSANDQPTAAQYEIKTTLFDSFVDICAPDVLNHFADNFDYHSIRDDLYRNIIVNEIFSDKFVLYELDQSQYLGVIKNFESYLKVNQEIINRWAHPIVLENLHISAKLKTSFKIKYSNVYFDGNSIEINPRAKVMSSNVLGSESVFEENCNVSGSVIGKEVKIGKNAIIKNSIIFQGTIIGDDVVIENSVIGRNCEVEKNIQIKNSYVGNSLFINFPDEPGKVLESLRIKLDLNNDDENSLSDEEEDDDDLYSGLNVKEKSETEILKEEKNNATNEKSASQSHKLELIDNNTFLMNLEDRDYMFTCAQENANEIEEELEDDINDDFTESDQEEQEEEDENYEDEMKVIVQSGIEDPDKISDIVQEIMALKFSFKYKTFSDSKYSVCCFFYLLYYYNYYIIIIIIILLLFFKLKNFIT